MAIKKCKECEGEVSTKAKTCPKCGAKAPKSTSLFTWLIAALATFYLIGVLISQSTQTTQTTQTTQSKQSSPQQSKSSTSTTSKPPEPQWTVTSSTDEMTGQKIWYANSPVTEASTKMGFPYGDTVSNLQVGCSQNTLMAYFYFNNEPNLPDDETKDGYNWITTRIKWNDNVLTSNFTQEWTSKFIHFVDDKDAIKKITTSDTVMLELNWAGNGLVRFPYSLKGATKALNELRVHCETLE